MRVIRRLVQEQILHHDAFHGCQRLGNVLGVRIGLEDVLALAVEPLEGAFDGRVEHVRNAQARLLVEGDAPKRLEHLPRGIARDVPVAGKLVREGAHVAGALHVVLAAQGVHAHARPADIAGRHGEVRDGHDRGRALAVLGDAEAVIDRAVAARGVSPRRAPDVSGGDAGELLDRLRAVVSVRNERRPMLRIRPSRSARG